MSAARSRVWRVIGVAVAASGLAAGMAGYVLTEAEIGVDARIGLFVYGGFALLVGVILATVMHSDLRLRRRLAAGEDVLARWRVDADTWRRFAEVDAGLRAADGGLVPNELELPDPVPAGGVDVVVGRGAVQVGERVYRVPERGAPEVLSATLDDSRLRLSYIELQLQYPPTQVGDAPTRALLRFPIADGSLAVARPVVKHFARETPQRPDFFHGPGDGSDPEDLSRCWSCGFETHTFRSTCPKCGAGLESRRWARRTGVVLILLGGALVTGMGWLSWYLWPALRHPGEDFGGMRFTGTPEQGDLVLSILGVVALFGALALAYGIFQLATGRRSKWVVQVIVALAAAMFVGGMLLR